MSTLFQSYYSPTKLTDPGNALIAFNTAIQHAGDLNTAYQNIKNTSLPWANKSINWLKTNGGSAGQLYLSQFSTIKNFLEDEVAKIAGA